LTYSKWRIHEGGSVYGLNQQVIGDLIFVNTKIKPLFKEESNKKTILFSK